MKCKALSCGDDAKLKEIGDCKVVREDSVAREHRMIKCGMILVKMKRRMQKDKIVESEKGTML